MVILNEFPEAELWTNMSEKILGPQFGGEAPTFWWSLSPGTLLRFYFGSLNINSPI